VISNFIVTNANTNTNTDNANFIDTDTTAELQTICKQYWQRLYNLEGDKFDLEHVQKLKAQEVNSKQILPCTQTKQTISKLGFKRKKNNLKYD